MSGAREFIKVTSNIYMSFLFNNLLWTLINLIDRADLISAMKAVHISRLLILLCGGDLDDTKFIDELYGNLMAALTTTKSPGTKTDMILSFIHELYERTIAIISPTIIRFALKYKEVLGGEDLTGIAEGVVSGEAKPARPARKEEAGK